MTIHNQPSQSRTATASLAALLITTTLTTTPANAEGKKESLTPLPSLNTVEECQRADLGRYYGKTFRFHHGECWADVAIDENGKITSFIPEDEEACKRALRENCGWVD